MSSDCYDDPNNPFDPNELGYESPGDPSVDGSEPECQAAYTRAAECYLLQSACQPGSADYAPVFAPGLAGVWCAAYAKKAGSLTALAEKLNATTPCTTHENRELCMFFEATPVTREACNDTALTADECSHACQNALRCELDVSGTQAQCEAACRDQPERSARLRCANVDERTSCDLIAACFSG